MNFSEILEFSDNTRKAYEKMCEPLCRKFQLPQTAFDILMFLANNPQYHTASDIVQIRKIKANLVSFHVEKLVQEGMLERRSLPEDRRKIILVCTPKSQPITKQGREMQQTFIHAVTAGIHKEDLQMIRETINRIGSNAAEIIKTGRTQE